MSVALRRDAVLPAHIFVLAEPVGVVNGRIGEVVGGMDEAEGIGVFLANGGCLELA